MKKFEVPNNAGQGKTAATIKVMEELGYTSNEVEMSCGAGIALAVGKTLSMVGYKLGKEIHERALAAKEARVFVFRGGEWKLNPRRRFRRKT